VFKISAQVVERPGSACLRFVIFAEIDQKIARKAISLVGHRP